jgi:hypothetical protein
MIPLAAVVPLLALPLPVLLYHLLHLLHLVLLLLLLLLLVTLVLLLFHDCGVLGNVVAHPAQLKSRVLIRFAQVLDAVLFAIVG